MKNLLRKIVLLIPRPLLSLLWSLYRSIFVWRDVRREMLQRPSGLSTIDPRRPVFVFFAPEAAMEAHFVAHCIVARTLKELGHQVLLVRCFDRYRQCVVKDMMKLPLHKTMLQRHGACVACGGVGAQMTAQYGLPTVEMGELLDAGAVEKICALVRSMPADAGEFEVDGVKFGALCGSDLALSLKTLDQMRATGEARELLEAYVEGALLSYFVVQSLAQRINIARLVFFNEYSMFMGAVIGAKKFGAPVMRISHAIHRNIDRRKIIMMSDTLAIQNYHRCFEAWDKWRDLALPTSVVEMVTDNNISRFNASGHTVYSPRYSGATGDVYASLNLCPSRKLLVAYTSSLDEFNSNRNLMAAVGVDYFQKEQPFQDQIEWLEALAARVENSQHLQLVVRIHPREGSNSFDSTESEHLLMLRARFSGSYNHVHFIWPHDRTSSYDLAENADVALTSWTNITMELARLGVPTLAAFKGINPVPIGEFVQWAPTQHEYFDLLEKMLDQPPNLATIRGAYRWTYCAYLASSLDFGDVVPAADYVNLPPFRMPAVAPLVERVVVEGQSVQDIAWQNLSRSQSPAVDSAEAEALRWQLRRFVWFLATGEDRPEDYRLCFGASAKLDQCDAVIVLDGQFVTFTTPERSVRRRSAAIVRLAGLAANVDAGVQPAMSA